MSWKNPLLTKTLIQVTASNQWVFKERSLPSTASSLLGRTKKCRRKIVNISCRNSNFEPRQFEKKNPPLRICASLLKTFTQFIAHWATEANSEQTNERTSSNLFYDAFFWSVFLNSLDKWQTTLGEMDKELNIRTRQKRLHKIETIQRFLCRRIPCFWLGIHVFLWFRNIDACSWLITVAVLAANFAKEQ